MDYFIENYHKREISIELVWKFFLLLSNNEQTYERTRSAIRKALGNLVKSKRRKSREISDSAFTYLLNLVEPFLISDRDPEIEGNKADQMYFNIDWIKILYYLVDQVELEEKEKEDVVSFLNMVLSLSEDLQIKLSFENDIFTKKTQLGKLVNVLVDSYPPLFFIILIGYYYVELSQQIDFNSISISQFKFPLSTVSFFHQLSMKSMEEIFNNLLKDINIKKVGSVSTIFTQGQTTSIEDANKIDVQDQDQDQAEEPLSANMYSKFILSLISLTTEGYLQYDDKVMISFDQEEDIDKTQPIEIIIPLSDGEKIIKKVDYHSFMNYIK